MWHYFINARASVGYMLGWQALVTQFSHSLQQLKLLKNVILLRVKVSEKNQGATVCHWRPHASSLHNSQ